jgi:hypothetical protein
MFLPRVQSGRSILQSAQWRLESFARQGEAPIRNQDTFADWFGHWRERWLVPRYVYLTSADNRLLYDLDDRLQVEDLRGSSAAWVTRASAYCKRPCRVLSMPGCDRVTMSATSSNSLYRSPYTGHLPSRLRPHILTGDSPGRLSHPRSDFGRPEANGSSSNSMDRARARTTC